MLVCDDDPSVLSVVGPLLEQAGYRVAGGIFQRRGSQVAHAQTGQEAIRLMQSLDPHLLVLDLVLPDGDGFKVVDWIRRNERLRVPLVVYTSRDLSDSLRSRLRLEQTLFFTKGRVTLQELEERVVGLTKTTSGKWPRSSLRWRAAGRVGLRRRPLRNVIVGGWTSMPRIIVAGLLDELAKSLEKSLPGLTAQVAHSGKEVLALLPQGNWDLLLINGSLDTMEGPTPSRVVDYT